MMEVEVYVLDTGPLSALAEAGWLGALQGLAAHNSWKPEMPEEVVDELRQGQLSHPANATVINAEWIDVFSIEEAAARDIFTELARSLVSGTKNIGECAVLARAKATGAVAVVDDGAARKHAKRHNIKHKGTLSLLLEAIRADYLTLEACSDVVDHLLATGYRLPFKPGEFARWAREELGL